jgi:Ca2+-binding EF-hand superfamily protein
MVFKEFLNMVLPLDNPRLREEIVNRDNYFVGDKEVLPYNVEYALARIVSKEIEMHTTVDKQLKDLLDRYDYNVQTAFKTIDFRHTRYIDFELLSAFLKKRASVSVQAEDVTAFIRRTDLDLDCKVSYAEFVAALQPIDPHTKTKPSYITPTKAFQAGSRPGSAAKTLTGMKKSSNTVSKKGFKNRSFYEVSQTPSKHTSTFQARPATEKKRPDAFLLRSEKKKKTTTTPLKAKSPIKKSPSPLKKTSHGSSAKKQPQSSPFRPQKLPDTVYSLMEEQLNQEKKLELIKQDLAVHADVTVSKICTLFDPTAKGYVGSVNFLETLREFGLSPDRESVYLVFNRFDRDLDGRLDYTDLTDMIMPIEEEYASVLQARISKERAKLSTDSMAVLKRLLQTYLDSARESEDLKHKLKGIDVRKAFEECDIDDVGFFTADNVGLFVEERK